ncbi:MAG: hypothetical protein DRP74_01160 [Candidatus Omnitrophota bacterium]|nr:MAG: hypothetical protein DRP74_01160 [Candidatus Omnitrophota bacterium]
MKTEVKKLDATKREIKVELTGDIVRKKFDEVFTRIGKDAKVKGFRPGHVPRDILEKEFSSTAHEYVIKELLPNIYNQAIKKENLDVIELPSISDVRLDKDILSFKATVELSPEIQLKRYKGIKVNFKKITVSSDDIKRNLDSLKESRKIDKIDDNFARGLGYPDLAELEKAIERQFFLQKENQQRQKIEKDLINDITKELNFKIPESMVKRQLQDLIRQAKIDLALKGASPEKIKEHEETLSKELEPRAKEQVKVYLVLSEIAKRENIPLDEQMPAKVVEFLLKEADWNISD